MNVTFKLLKFILNGCLSNSKLNSKIEHVISKNLLTVLMSVESQLEETAGYLPLQKYIHFKDCHVTKVHTKQDLTQSNKFPVSRVSLF